MQRAAIVSGVLGLGSVLVFAAAALGAALFPNGATVSAGWNSWGGDRLIAPAPMPMPALGGPGVIIDDGKDIALPDVVVDK